MTESLISIIVPVYDVEKYLNKCINSIVNQTYKRLEIILVDDGSPDNCPTLCDEWAKKDSRIRVIHKQNAGVSAARNSGLNIATGEYIGFVDSDDYIEPQMIEKLFSGILESGSDMAVCGYTENDFSIFPENSFCCTVNEARCMLFNNDEHRYFNGFCWNKLYLASLIRENGLQFDTSLKKCEDTLFNFNYLKCVEKVYICSYVGYYYYMRGDSVTHTKRVQNDYDMVTLVERFINEAQSEKELECIVVWANWRWISAIDDHLVFNNGKEYYETAIERIKENKKILLNSHNVPAVKKIYTLLLSYFKLPYIIYKKSILLKWAWLNPKSLLCEIVNKLTDSMKLREYILFESAPYYSDNTKAVFDEVIKRGWNKKNKLIWVCQTEEDADAFNMRFANEKNVEAVYVYSPIYKYYYRKTAKAFIVCNLFLYKAKKEQYYCNLAHGGAIKDVSGKYSVPDECKDCDNITLSDFLAPYDAQNLSVSVDTMVALGFARNDDLFKHIDVHSVFSGVEFNKLIYWMPTFRQNRWGDPAHSNISMPIIYNAEIAAQINDCAKANGVLIVVKIHQAQDISKITEYNFSNLVFIKADFFDNKDFSNYQLLGSSDALISDYSSVYYDYLLCDKPIAVCWDDFEEYKKREGFRVDPFEILAGAEKIYTAEELCAFIKSVASGEDRLCDIRRELRDKVHDYPDNKSTQRIVDYLEEKIFG